LEVSDLRLSRAMARAYLPTWVGVPRTPIAGRLGFHGPMSRLRVDGNLRAARGRVKISGWAAPASQRARLDVAGRGVEPGLLPSQERMVMGGAARVIVRGREARFVVAGRYHHRRPDAQVKGASFETPTGGTLHGSGTVRARRAVTGHFLIRV